jgi:transposase
VTCRRALEASAELRSVFHARRAFWRSNQLIFIDESAANERTGDRKYGWSPRGVECVSIRPVQRSERWSILPALTIDGYLPGTLIYQGSITSEIFCAWIREILLPRCNTDTILILDNASIHRTTEFFELIEQAQIQLEYLPPYSPDYNPIELSFRSLKAWIKRNIRLADSFERFSDYLRQGIEEVGRQTGRGHFRTCGYTLE